MLAMKAITSPAGPVLESLKKHWWTAYYIISRRYRSRRYLRSRYRTPLYANKNSATRASDTSEARGPLPDRLAGDDAV
jgi:hypothetical protein